MYIETRYYESGKVTARLRTGYHEGDFKQLEEYDVYYENIKDDSNKPYEWESLEEWGEEYGLELEELESLLLGGVVDITNHV